MIGARSKGRGRRSRNSRPLQSAPSPAAPAEERIDPFGRRPQDGPHHPGETRQSLGQTGRIGPTRVHGVDRDAARVRRLRGGEPTRARGRPGALRPGSRPRVRPDARLQIVEIEALGNMPPDVTAMTSTPWSVAGGGAVPTPARMGRRPSWRTSLDPVAGLATVRKDRAGVVDKDVEATLRRCDTIDRVGDRGERRHIRDHDGESVDASAAMSVERSSVSRDLVRPTRTTRAPSAAIASAAARPRPDVGPVTRTVFRRAHRAAGPTNRRADVARRGRSAKKEPTTVSSRPPSMSARGPMSIPKA